MTSEDTLYSTLLEYVHVWYDGLNDAHEHDMHHHMYQYIETINEFSEDYE